jgi:predicted HTH domain antitoxin
MPLAIKIPYPKSIPDALQETPEEFEQEARIAMAVKLFEMKKLSSGMAADLAGMERTTFLLLLHRYNVDAIDITELELLEDIKNA